MNPGSQGQVAEPVDSESRLRKAARTERALFTRDVRAVRGWGRRRFIDPLRDLSIGQAALVAVLGLLTLAFGVLWLTGRPSTTGWNELGVEPMPWKDRLTYAGAVATAVGAVIALVVSYRKQRDAEEGRFATLFAEAAAQLGNPAPAVRIAGVYVLAALADRYSTKRQQVIDALCGYLRLPYNPVAGAGHQTTRTTETRDRDDHERAPKVTTIETYRPEDREVRLTIIRVIRDHLRNPTEATTWCGHDLDFTGATFDGGDFSGAHFTGATVHFSGAQFSGGTIHFYEAQFNGATVNFFRARFSGGTVNFATAQLNGAMVRFDRAQFNGGTLTFARAQLSGGTIDFYEAQFNGGTVTFDGTRFIGGQLQFRSPYVHGHFDLVASPVGVVTRDGRVFTGTPK